MQLSYDQWTRIDPGAALPAQAEVDWLRGAARAPCEWELQVDADNLDVRGLDDAPVAMDEAYTFRLGDVRRCTTIAHVCELVAASLARLGEVRMIQLRLRPPLAEPTPLAVSPPSPSPPRPPSPEAPACEQDELNMAQLFSMDTCSDCQLQATVLAPDDTVEDADLFNKLARMEVHAVVDGRRLERQAGASQPCSRYLLPPSLPPPIPPPPSFAHRKPSSPHTAGPGRGYWEQRARVSSPAHNPKPKAPEHVGLLNNLAAEDPHRHDAKTHLPNWVRVRLGCAVRVARGARAPLCERQPRGGGRRLIACPEWNHLQQRDALPVQYASSGSSNGSSRQHSGTATAAAPSAPRHVRSKTSDFARSLPKVPKFSFGKSS